MSKPSVVLTRILGNSLPPLHSPEQTLTNTRFILENEAQWGNCQKSWILNRIRDEENKSALIELLHKYKQEFVDLPFDPKSYREIGFTYDHFPVPDFLSSKKGLALSERHLGIAYCACLHEKNGYLMNNNGARNIALLAARAKADWCLPWDGNCFLTDDAYEALLETFQRCDYEKYVIVPMHRCENNAAILEPTFQPCPLDEPQVAFRSDSAEQFDERYVYGFKSKVSLLQRLGVPGIWDQFPAMYPWNKFNEPCGKESHQHVWGSYVVRLAPETRNRELGYTQRGMAREALIVQSVRDVDFRWQFCNAEENGLLLLSGRKLKWAKESTDNRALELKRCILLQASEAFSGATPDNNETAKDISSHVHCQRQILICSLAFVISFEQKYGRYCADLLRKWLKNICVGASYTTAFQFSALSDAKGNKPALFTAARGVQLLPLVLDAVTLLRDGPAWSEEDELLLGRAVSCLQSQLKRAPKACSAMINRGADGVAYDLHSTALAAFSGDREGLYENLMRIVGRLTGFVRLQESERRHWRDPEKFAGLLASMRVWIVLDVLVYRVLGKKLIDITLSQKGEMRTLRDVLTRLVKSRNDHCERCFQSELSHLQCYFDCSQAEGGQDSSDRSLRSRSYTGLYEVINQMVMAEILNQDTPKISVISKQCTCVI